MLKNYFKLQQTCKTTHFLYKYNLLQTQIKTKTVINPFLKNYIDFTKTQTIYFNKLKFLKNLYDITLLFNKIKQQKLKILFINPLKIKTLNTKLINNFLINFIKTTKMYYYTGSWVNGFITANLFLQTSTEANFKKKKINFFCPTKPHFALIIINEETTNIVNELTKAGIPIIGLGSNNTSDPRISYFIPTNLETENQLFFWLKFFQTNLGTEKNDNI